MRIAVPFRLLVLLVSVCLLNTSLVSADKKPEVSKNPKSSEISPSESAAKNSPAKRPEIMPLAQIKPGMRGVAYTVFQGIKPEPMEVEVLGVLKNMNGPKSDMILV